MSISGAMPRFIIDCFVFWAFSSDYAHFIFTHYQAVIKKTKKNFTFLGTKFFYLRKAFYIRGMVAMKHHTKTKHDEKFKNYLKRSIKQQFY